MRIPSDVLDLISALESAGYTAYLVGGCVRDMLLGVAPSDYDLTTSATPEEIMNVFSERDVTVLPTGLKHGTVGIRYHHATYEITTFRKDGIYLDGRHPENVSFSKTLEEDLLRRDFTINAMAYHPKTGLVDLCRGQEDLKKSLVRAVGDPQLRFREDALRMLRAVRFASRLNFAIEENTLLAIQNSEEKIHAVSSERIAEEFRKILECPHPSYGVQLLKESLLWARLFPSVSFPESKVPALDSLPADFCLRFGFLFSDSSDEAVSEAIRFLRLSNKEKSRIQLLWEGFTSPLPGRNDPIGQRLFLQKYGSDSLPLLACLGKESPDALSLYPLLEKEQDRGLCLTVSDLAVSGKDLLDAGIAKGPLVGDLLEYLLSMVIAYPDDNRRDRLLSLAQKYVHPKIRNIVFDIGKVLAKFHWKSVLSSLGFSPEANAAVAAATVRNPFWLEYDRSVLSDEEVLQTCCSFAPEYTKEITAFFGHLFHMCTPYPYASEWLSSLRKRGYRVYLLSNYGKTRFEQDLTDFPFVAETDGRVISYEVGYIKPEPGIYYALLDKYHLLPEESLFFDDVEANVLGARRCGFHAEVFTTPEEAEKVLSSLS